MIEHELAGMSAAGQLESHLHALEILTERLQQVPLWLPSVPLAREAREARVLIAGMQARLERGPVVTLIGPSGAGKSTLLNALAGIDELSPSGGRRPTTHGLVVLAEDSDSVRQVLGAFNEDQVQIRSAAGSAAFSAMLIDTPDTDSTRNQEHWPLIAQAVSHSDILICLFDAQNPKRRDHADFMAPLVRRFNGGSLVAVLNHSDRLNGSELTEVIAPEFQAYLQQAWEVQPESLLIISARRHLQNPGWDPKAPPRHDLDQFEQLRRLVSETFGRSGFGQDRRLANANQIRLYVQGEVRRAAEQDQAPLQQALQGVRAAEELGLRKAVERLIAENRRGSPGGNVRLYQALSQRWLGPVGWMVAIWARLILFSSGLSSLVRFGNSLHQIRDMVSGWRGEKHEEGALAGSHPGRLDLAWQAFQKVWWTQWPPISELLIQGHFDPRVRRVEVQQTQKVSQLASTLWAESLDVEIERSARMLSHMLLQLLFNLPTLLLLGYVAWLTVTRFLTASFLSGGFFLNALLAIAVVLLLSFFLFQGLVRLALGRDRMQKRAFRAVENAIGNHPLLAGREIAEQVEQVLGFECEGKSIVRTAALQIGG